MQLNISARYGVILADPPWAYSDRGASGSMKPSGSASHYATLTNKQIGGLNVADFAEDDSLCFLWVTGPHMNTGLDVLAAWGFTFRTVGFGWVKTGTTDASAKKLRGILRDIGLSRAGVRSAITAAQDASILWPAFPIGQGAYSRANPEYVLIGKRGKGIKRQDAGVRSEVLEPRGPHSAKPPEVHRRIERLVGGSVAKLELFARQPVQGWHVWGNQIDSDIKLTVPGVEN